MLICTCMIQEVNIAYASGALLLSFTHMGEPGYTMIIPAEYTLHIYNQLMKVSFLYLCIYIWYLYLCTNLSASKISCL